MDDREIEYILEELGRLEAIEQQKVSLMSEELSEQSKPEIPKPPKVLYQTRKGKWINPVNSYKSNQRGKR